MERWVTCLKTWSSQINQIHLQVERIFECMNDLRSCLLCWNYSKCILSQVPDVVAIKKLYLLMPAKMFEDTRVLHSNVASYLVLDTSTLCWYYEQQHQNCCIHLIYIHFRSIPERKIRDIDCYSFHFQ